MPVQGEKAELLLESDPSLNATGIDGVPSNHLASEDLSMNGSDPATVNIPATETVPVPNGVDLLDMLQNPELATANANGVSDAANAVVALDQTSLSTSTSNVAPDAYVVADDNLAVPAALLLTPSKSPSVEQLQSFAQIPVAQQDFLSSDSSMMTALPAFTSSFVSNPPTKISSLATDPELARQTASQLLASRKPLALSRLARLRQRVEKDRFDGEAWLELIADAAQKGDLEKTREIYEGYLKAFPDNVRVLPLMVSNLAEGKDLSKGVTPLLTCLCFFCILPPLLSLHFAKSGNGLAKSALILFHLSKKAREWIAYADLELSHGNNERVNEIFGRCLRSSPSVQLWHFYLTYIRRTNPIDRSSPERALPARDVITKAFEFSLAHIGADLEAGVIWYDYIEFLKEGEVSCAGSSYIYYFLKLKAIYLHGRCLGLGRLSRRWTSFDKHINARYAFL